MITFVDLIFSPEGVPAGVAIDRLQRLDGVTSVMGEHDVLFRWQTTEEFTRKMQLIHEELRGTGAQYRIHTVEDSYQSMAPLTWFPGTEADTSGHPAYTKK
jgi:hypothetical protein